MKFQSLFSGSKGNCSVLQAGNSKILVDCGFSAATIENALKSNGVCPEGINAVFVTHEHSDHIGGLSSFCARHKNVEVFVHESSEFYIQKILPSGSKLNTFNGNTFDYNGLTVSTYDCDHDSAHCSGFKFLHDGVSVAVVTDLGRATEGLFDFVKGCSLLLLESNHDEKMLAGGSYPFPLKKRIASSCGHLSNRQAGEILQRLPELEVRNVWLGHLSLKNNTPEIAFQSAVTALKEKQITEGQDIFVSIVGQFAASKIFGN